MSIRAFTWAFDEVTGVNRGEKLVLLALAEFANDDDITWRARHEIARRALCSDRSLTDYLTSLEAKGFIEREARYHWCDSLEGACEGRPSHKHRCGTTYRVRRDRKSPVNIPPLSTPANFASVGKKSVCAGRATDAKSAGVEPQPQNSVVHTSKILHPYDSYNRQLINSNPPTPQTAPERVAQGLVGNKSKNASARLQQSCAAVPAAGGRAGVVAAPREPVARPCPSVNPQDPAVSLSKPLEGVFSPTVGGKPSEGGFNAFKGASCGSGEVLDQGLLDEVLPKVMRDLPVSAARKVAILLRERVDNGWSVPALRARLGEGNLPVRVRNLAGLVLFRVGDIPACPPHAAVKTKPQVVQPLEEEESVTEPVTVDVAREVAWFFTPGVLGVNESAVGNEKHWREQAKRILADHGQVFDQAILAGESVPQSLRKAVRAGDSRGY